MMKILKFGGSSIRDAERIKNVIYIVKNDLKNNNIVGIVFSAFQGVTDDLLSISNLAAVRNELYVSEFLKLKERHLKTTAELLSAKTLSKTEYSILSILNELEEILKGVYLIKERSAKTLDLILSFGELLSNTIISLALFEDKIENELLDTREIIITDRNFGSARVLFDNTDNNIKNYFTHHKKLQIITGFIASTLQKETITLGRGEQLCNQCHQLLYGEDAPHFETEGGISLAYHVATELPLDAGIRQGLLEVRSESERQV